VDQYPVLDELGEPIPRSSTIGAMTSFISVDLSRIEDGLIGGRAVVTKPHILILH
jgi:hypothetical protein